MRKHNIMPKLELSEGMEKLSRVRQFDSQGRAVYDVWSTWHGKYVLECLHCDVLFLSDRPHTKYHSKACRQAAYRVRKIEHGKEN